jgi:hypothetical protein
VLIHKKYKSIKSISKKNEVEDCVKKYFLIREEGKITKYGDFEEEVDELLEYQFIPQVGDL